ncbi:ABC transporter permease [Ornithinimicrobium ciconiae]|uniref:ABC transporter permease n=1 Tax=Ornithinimicrobium ciconiae TaxID=2594265 RepID=A0A516GBF5_9MICO|nr:ABC transporter permease [Ornithinimicrobium ciconiae]QDO88832.1 ABC transporter permease [Ornithinimicrobium ciconiae]
MSTAPPANRHTATPGRPAPTARRILTQAVFETKGLLSHGEQLLVSVVLPLMALTGLAVTDVPSLGEGERIDLATAGVFALAIISTAFTGQAILLGFERRWGVLRMLGTTPLGRGGLLPAKALSVLAVVAVQFVVLGAVAAFLGWRPELSGLPGALAVTIAGVLAFASLAALIGGTLRAEGVLALANLLWILLAALGGVLISADRYPAPWDTVVSALPSAALGDGMREALVHGAFPATQILILLAWAGLTAALATRLLRWSD